MNVFKTLTQLKSQFNLLKIIADKLTEKSVLFAQIFEFCSCASMSELYMRVCKLDVTC